jgi:DNA-binding response OmpR family regulator
MAVSVLIVDDDPNILDTANEILEDAGYLVKTAGTGAAAMSLLKAFSPDIAIFDFNLPDTTGIELSLQAKSQNPKMKVILMTGEGHVDPGPAKDSIDYILTKPVNPAKLLVLLRAIVDL